MGGGIWAQSLCTLPAHAAHAGASTGNGAVGPPHREAGNPSHRLVVCRLGGRAVLPEEVGAGPLSWSLQ